LDYQRLDCFLQDQRLYRLSACSGVKATRDLHDDARDDGIVGDAEYVQAW
jgi:hypothetical protein